MAEIKDELDNETAREKGTGKIGQLWKFLGSVGGL
jgi:hypothetical protein